MGSGQVAVHLANWKNICTPLNLIKTFQVYVFFPDYVLLKGWVGGSASNRTLFVWEKPCTKMDDPLATAWLGPTVSGTSLWRWILQDLID